MEKITLRYAQRKDMPLIMEFIKGLAEYEGMLGMVTATEDLLEEWLFDKERAEVLFCNLSSIGFYKSLGGKDMDICSIFRLENEALKKLAEE